MTNTIQDCKLQIVREKNYTAPDTINKAEDLLPLIHEYLGNPDREHMVVIALDTRNHPIGINTVSVGTVDRSIVSPREVFKFALLANAPQIILVHNHPSGDTHPSQADINITMDLRAAGKLLDIDILDHVIIGYSVCQYTSIKNYLPNGGI